MTPAEAAALSVGISAVSLTLAALSLGWQVSLWLLGGRRIRVRLVHGVIGKGGVVSGPVKAGAKADIASLRTQGFNGPEVLGVQVINIGRLPVTLTSYTVKVFGGGMSYSPLADSIGPSLPFRLEAGESETWYVDFKYVRALASSDQAVGKDVSRAYMTVDLATKHEKRTRQSVPAT